MQITRRKFSLAASMLLPLSARAQEKYPGKPIRLVVPYAAGGGTDTIARLVAQAAGQVLGTSFVVENNGAAGGNIATSTAAKAPNDGYTVLMANQGPMVVNPHLFKSLDVDPLKAFDPVCLIASAPLMVVMPKDSRFSSLRDLVNFGVANPGKLTYASPGNGSAGHLATMLLQHLEKLDAVHIPFRGAAPAVSEVLAGRVDLLITTLPSVLGQIEAGSLRAVAVTSKTRVARFPDIPAMAELGWPDVDVGAWYGFVVPKGTPRRIIDMLRQATLEAVNTPLLRERFTQEGARAMSASPEEFGAMMAVESARWAQIIKASGLKLD